MTIDLDGSTPPMGLTLITGAASGIGLALSLVYLQKGCTVVMIDKNLSKLKEEVQTLESHFPDQVLYKICDITRQDEVQLLAQDLGKHPLPIHRIYNNAGILGPLGCIWELEPEQIHQVMEVNLYGMIHVIRSFMPVLFQQNKKAHVINVASLYALCSGSQVAPYSMSKHAVLALSESLYFDLKRLGKSIHVSVAFPSFTDTSLLSNPLHQHPSALHHSLNALLSHSRPAMDLAKHLVQEAEQKRFYLLPDKEVKEYCNQRAQAIIQQEDPHKNSIEKLMNKLIKAC